MRKEIVKKEKGKKKRKKERKKESRERERKRKKNRKKERKKIKPLMQFPFIATAIKFYLYPFCRFVHFSYLRNKSTFLVIGLALEIGKRLLGNMNQ